MAKDQQGTQDNKVTFSTKPLRIEAADGEGVHPDAELLLQLDDPYVGEGEPRFVLQNLEAADRHVVVDRVIARWRDPFTLPRSRAVCVKWARGDWPWGGGWKVCVGHKYQTSWMDVTARLSVTVATPQEVRAAIEECLRQGAIVAALSAILSAATGNPGGLQAAVGTFVATVRSCLEQKLRNIVNVTLTTSSEWSDYA